MEAKETLYLNADKTEIVGEDSKDAAFLLARIGCEIPPEVIEKYGLTAGGKNVGKKTDPPAENKTKTPKENK